jgi:plasmid maintenance system antidote protein VapI
MNPVPVEQAPTRGDPPGVTLAAQMQKYRQSVRNTAQMLFTEEHIVEGFLTGTIRISEVYAQRLEQVFDPSAEDWLRLEHAYRGGPVGAWKREGDLYRDDCPQTPDPPL